MRLSALNPFANPSAARGPAVPEVNVESLGREHAGKTGVRTLMFRLAQDGPLPSGLELTTRDPRAMVRLMNDSIASFQGLRAGGFTSTIEPDLIRYDLYQADRPRAVLHLRESVGQLLTYTDEASGDRLQGMFRAHHGHLAAADVVHVYVSCPADDSRASTDRLKNDLAVLMPNLRQVLAAGPAGRTKAVVVVLTKPDGCFASAEAARAALPDDRLRGLLGRLVTALEGSDRVGLGAVFVTSAFGYGKARRLDTGAADGAGPLKGFSLLSQGEPEWACRPTSGRSRTTCSAWSGGPCWPAWP